MNSSLLTVTEVAKILKVSEARVYELARTKVIPIVRLGRQIRFDTNQLQSWIQQGGKPLPGVWRREPA